ncbi:MAG: hypothetical protein BZY75_00970 [SAR202 cluster bacterium Io17-Chloro-G7]|nr:MAG: hypothetical protein BZY75_00970 [SAR202 cluster bacterium Io17-Chloro-G7]
MPSPDAAALDLQVITPLENALITEETFTVAGVTRPDATVSVNGILAAPDLQGNFAVELTLSSEDNPFSIEVIASSITGENRSIVLTQIAAGGLLFPDSEGYFGAISHIASEDSGSASGEPDLILATGTGPVKLTITADTIVRIPGLASASVGNLLGGDPVAVLVTQGRAVSILARDTQPHRTSHFSGIATAIDTESGTVSIQSPGGEIIKAPWLSEPLELMPGTMVTAIIEHDLASGSLIITGLDTAKTGLERLAMAIEKAEAEQPSRSIDELKQRLLSHSAARLTVVGEAADRLAAPLHNRGLQQLAFSLQSIRETLSRFDAGEPQRDYAGIVTSINLDLQVITVEQPGLKPVDVSVASDARFWRAPVGLPPTIAESWLRGDGDTHRDTQSYANEFGGRETGFRQLDLANRVRLRYGFDTGNTTRVLVLPAASLQNSKIGVLLDLSATGAAIGMITSVDKDSQPPAVRVQDEISGRTLTLTVSPDSELMEGPDSISVSALTGASVDVSYDPDTMSVLRLNSSPPGDVRERVHGVVHSMVSKVAPGNLIVVTNTGDLRPLNHTRDTMIFRDGRRVTISQVRIGDLVQPDSYVLAGNGGDNLMALNLKSPKSAPVSGTIRWVRNISDSQSVITLTTNWLDTINILVDGDTHLIHEGSPMTVDEFAVGQRVVGGEFDPISGLASKLVIGTPESVHIRGQITSVGLSDHSIEITSDSGERIRLFVSGPVPLKIALPGLFDANVRDLRVGQIVRIGFYNPATKHALLLVLN